ncbi:hypothetical protein PUN4_560066 [Paraburkholderia unamae]|nr:hypothetical protein PUN4_560066 [Paraburkholderia unamae]
MLRVQPLFFEKLQGDEGNKGFCERGRLKDGRGVHRSMVVGPANAAVILRARQSCAKNRERHTGNFSARSGLRKESFEISHGFTPGSILADCTDRGMGETNIRRARLSIVTGLQCGLATLAASPRAPAFRTRPQQKRPCKSPASPFSSMSC